LVDGPVHEAVRRRRPRGRALMTSGFALGFRHRTLSKRHAEVEHDDRITGVHAQGTFPNSERSRAPRPAQASSSSRAHGSFTIVRAIPEQPSAARGRAVTGQGFGHAQLLRVGLDGLAMGRSSVRTRSVRSRRRSCRRQRRAGCPSRSGPRRARRSDDCDGQARALRLYEHSSPRDRLSPGSTDRDLQTERSCFIMTDGLTLAARVNSLIQRRSTTGFRGEP